MNWDALGAIAELAGALAVVATLVYLALQMKQNSKLVEQNNRLLDVSIANSIRDAQNEVSRILSSNAQASAIFWGGLEGRDTMSQADKRQFDSMMFLTFSSSQQGLVTDSQETSASLKWTVQYLGARQWWAEYSNIFTEPMQQLVAELMKDQL
jgi:hypothetical protein